MRNFFISFNKDDKEWAEWIAWTLEEAGYSVWYQEWDFRAGENFVVNIDHALEQSERMIAVLSESFLSSGFTKMEWSTVLARDPDNKNRSLLPVRVGECKPHGLLAPIAYTDLVGFSEGDARNALQLMLSGKRGSSRPPRFPGARPDASDSPRVAPTAKTFPGPVIEGNRPAPNLGRVVALSCNRKPQHTLFQEEFETNVQNWRSYPQVYVVHGRRKERHSSLVARFQETTIKDYAEYLKTRGPVDIWDPEWSYKLDPKVAKQQLIERLIRRSHQNDPRFRFEKQEHSAASFRKAISSLGNSVVMVQHEIKTDQWVKTTGALIKSYLEFWDEVKAGSGTVNGGSDAPQFIVFLKVVYPVLESPPWKVWKKWPELTNWIRKKQIIAQLRRLRKLSNGELSSEASNGGLSSEAKSFCLYTLLDELPRVGLADLVTWFEENNLGRNEVAWEIQSRNIFRNKGWKFHERRSMAEIEDALDEFIEAIQFSSDEITKKRFKQ